MTKNNNKGIIAKFLETTARYKGVAVLSDECSYLRQEDYGTCIAIGFEESWMGFDCESYWDGDLEDLVELLDGLWYDIEWYNSCELHAYPQEGGLF